jgi:hypothetical protein
VGRGVEFGRGSLETDLSLGGVGVARILSLRLPHSSLLLLELLPTVVPVIRLVVSLVAIVTPLLLAIRVILIAWITLSMLRVERLGSGVDLGVRVLIGLVELLG